jgi:tripartite-type tricarboxylate transporter receptor subunit TctC
MPIRQGPEDRGLKNRYQQQGAEATPSTPEEFLKIQRAEFQRVAKIVKEIGIKPSNRVTRDR